jgi:hypothetical protein
MKESASPGFPLSALGLPIMPKTSPNFDLRKPVSYDNAAKRAFHSSALRQLKLLANALGLAPGAYALSSNPGGIAVSGEVTLHADHVYVHACQPATGHDTGIMYRTCRGRKDYHRGPNNFASLTF